MNNATRLITQLIKIILYSHVIYGVYGRVDYREYENGKNKKKDGKNEEGKITVGLRYFLSDLTKKFSLQNEEKT